jgi:DNA-binding response OmpR family regulator
VSATRVSVVLMAEPSRKKILVIEDDPVAQKMVTDFLVAKGYQVHWAMNGVDGLEVAQLVDPDLVLCDVLLPRKSGFEVCFELKRAGKKQERPVILMSAILSGDADQRYAKEGVRADAFLAKPFSMSAMLSRIQQFLPAA